ncbi:MAG: alkaline phosphatase [bacterium]|nr:alkaline phosphatase [bacterium]
MKLRLFIFILILSALLYSENVILIITDGMSLDALSIHRKLISGSPVETQFERFTDFALCETTADNTYITDSAAAATALFCGEKTSNGVIGMDKTAEYKVRDGVNLENITEYCSAYGFLSGIVTNTRITHATPAGTYAHIKSRDSEYDIALQLVKTNINLIMGGGQKQFSKDVRYDKRDLFKEMEKKNYTIAKDKKDLKKINIKKNFFGLFGLSHMAYEYDKDTLKEPRLSHMADYALKYLDLKAKKEGKEFFLMIEAGRIDHAAHYHELKEYIFEVFELENLVKRVLDYAESTRTTVIMVSDHATGNPSFVGVRDEEGFSTMEGYFREEKFFYPDKNSLDSLLDNIVIEFVDASKFGGESEDPSYKGDHSGSDVPCFLYSKKYQMSDIVIKNTDILPMVKRQLGRCE